jgi:hypothetical protein
MVRKRDTSGLRPPWKKGESGNKSGGPKLPAVLTNVKLHTVNEIKHTISKHFRMKREEIAKVLQDPNSPALDLVIASTIASAIKAGDIHKAEYLFTRLVGRVTEKIELQHPEPVMIERPSGEQIVLDVEKVEE